MPFRGALQILLFVTAVVAGASSLVVMIASESAASDPVPTTVPVTIPTTTTTIYVEPLIYVVQRGDTLFRIAEKNQVDMRLLMEMNGINNPNALDYGRKLKLPPATGFVPMPVPTTMAP